MTVKRSCIANCGSVLPDDLVIERKTYDPGATVEEACNSILAHNKVDIRDGADVTWRAPRVALGSLVFIGPGGSLRVDPRSPAGCAPAFAKDAPSSSKLGRETSR